MKDGDPATVGLPRQPVVLGLGCSGKGLLAIHGRRMPPAGIGQRDQARGAARRASCRTEVPSCDAGELEIRRPENDARHAAGRSPHVFDLGERKDFGRDLEAAGYSRLQ